MDNSSLLAELLQLASEKQIPYTASQLKKMSMERLEEVMQEYKLKELDQLNETLADVVIIKMEEISKNFSLIRKDSMLAKKLQERKLFKRDLKNIVSYITPFLPYVGLLEGALVYGAEVLEKWSDVENKNEDSTSKTSQGEKCDTSDSKPTQPQE